MTRLLKFIAIAAIAALAIALPAVLPASAVFAQTAKPPATAPLSQATVKALQDALNKQGIAVNADGVLGDSTRAALRQYQSQHHLPVTGEPDKATLDKLGVAASGVPAGSPAAGSAAPGQTMGPGMGAGMMTPEMMQMMQGMMSQGGMPGQGMPGAGAGPGMMGQMPMAGAQPGPGAMAGSGMMAGTGFLLGIPHGAPAEMTEDRVRALLEQQLALLGNPRLKLGAVRTAGDGSIIAEISTVDGSLVQKLAFNRYPGLVRQVD